ncbi:MAG TPA: hypothetical protein VHB21_27505, partial [Minicystis sp.]|nr:hypothetical protein [Minicystis sp.]
MATVRGRATTVHETTDLVFAPRLRGGDFILPLPGGSFLTRPIVLCDVVRGRDELPQAVRLRLVLDLLRDLSEDLALEPRSAGSRLRLEHVELDAEGRASCRGVGDETGAQVLVWEVLASRPAPEGELPRVHDIVDELHADVDDVVARAVALGGDPATAGELLAALASA